MNRKNSMLATLGLLSLLVGVGGVVAPVFAWHVVSFTTTASTTSAAIGTGVYDTANLQLSNNGAPNGSITFYIYSGTCNAQGNPTGTLKYTSPSVSVTSAATGAVVQAISRRPCRRPDMQQEAMCGLLSTVDLASMVTLQQQLHVNPSASSRVRLHLESQSSRSALLR